MTCLQIVTVIRLAHETTSVRLRTASVSAVTTRWAVTVTSVSAATGASPTVGCVSVTGGPTSVTTRREPALTVASTPAAPTVRGENYDTPLHTVDQYHSCYLLPRGYLGNVKKCEYYFPWWRHQNAVTRARLNL